MVPDCDVSLYSNRSKVDEAHQSASVMTVESRLKISCASVLRKPDLGLTIINIIKTCLWIFRITHNKCTSKAIA